MERAFYTWIFLHLTFALFAQEQEAYRFYGRVMKKDSFTAVKYAYVANTTKGMSKMADSLGYFDMDVHPHDTLFITALGSADKIYVVPEEMPHEYSEWIYLEHRTYEIEEATVYYLGTYREFKQKVLDLKLPEPDKFNPAAMKFFTIPSQEADPYAGPGLTSPVSLLYMALNGDLKELRKAEDIHEALKRREKYAGKFNSKIVAQVTGLNGAEIDRFMHFCGFTDAYLLETDKYKILQAVKLKFAEYQEKKKEGTLPSLDNLD